MDESSLLLQDQQVQQVGLASGRDTPSSSESDPELSPLLPPDRKPLINKPLVKKQQMYIWNNNFEVYPIIKLHVFIHLLIISNNLLQSYQMYI